METKKKKVKSNVDESKDYPAEEQGILPKETSEEIKDDFMEGASGGGQLAKDALTGEPLMGEDSVVEIEIDGQRYRFVNQENAEKFRKKKEEEI